MSSGGADQGHCPFGKNGVGTQENPDEFGNRFGSCGRKRIEPLNCGDPNRISFRVGPQEIHQPPRTIGWHAIGVKHVMARRNPPRFPLDHLVEGGNHCLGLNPEGSESPSGIPAHLRSWVLQEWQNRPRGLLLEATALCRNPHHGSGLAKPEPRPLLPDPGREHRHLLHSRSRPSRSPLPGPRGPRSGRHGTSSGRPERRGSGGTPSLGARRAEIFAPRLGLSS